MDNTQCKMTTIQKISELLLANVRKMSEQNIVTETIDQSTDQPTNQTDLCSATHHNETGVD